MSGLSAVVNNLVRSQMGSSLEPTVTDEDLDKAVAELILKEAKKKADLYSQDGIKAYLRSSLADPNAPRPNKRFLSSIIKSTDDHNKTILRAQAEAAYEIKQEKMEREMRERRERAEEAAEAERNKRSGRSSRSYRRRHRTPDSDRSRSRERRRDRSRSRDRRKRRDRPREKEKRKVKEEPVKEKRRREKSEEEELELDWDRWDGRTASRKRRRIDDWENYSPMKEGRVYSPEPDPVDREEELRQKLRSSRTKRRSCSRSRSPSPWTRRLIAVSQSEASSQSLQTPPSSPGPHPLPPLPSKMDKYFEESYDPRLDVAPLKMPVIPSTGIITDEDFAGWERMLDVIREREDRKRFGISSIPQKGMSSGSGYSSQPNLMDIAYSKKGSVREWDVGKDNSF